MVGRCGPLAVLVLAALLGLLTADSFGSPTWACPPRAIPICPNAAWAPPPLLHPDESSEARAAVKAYANLKRHSSPLISMLALGGLAAFDHPVMVDLLLSELESDRVERYRSARRVLEAFSDPLSLAHLLKNGLGHRRPHVREQVLLVLGTSLPEHIDWQGPATAALSDPSPRVRAAALEALAHARHTSVLSEALAMIGDSSVRVRQMVPESLVRLAPQRAFSMLRALRNDPSWRVRVAITRALGTLRSQHAVELLIDMLEQETGRVREDALIVLTELTGQDFGIEVPAWRRYLETAPEDFLSMTASRELKSSLPSNTRVYYGLRTLSQRILFITDLSGSMSTMETSGYRLRQPGTRLELTQTELRTLIDELDADTYVNLIDFTEKAQLWSKKLLPMTDRNRKRAIQAVTDYRAKGSTNIFDALESAFDMAEVSLDHPNREADGPDTIFFLTDGTPSTGKLRDVNLLLQYVGERNRSLKLRIHCIALTKEGSSGEFMRRIARLTGGRYVNPLD